MFNRMMLRAIALSLLLAAASTAGYYAGAQGKEAEKPKSTLKVNQIARVGPRIITAEQVIARTYEVEQTMKDERYRILTNSVNYLVQVALLNLEGDRIGCELKPKEVESEVLRQVDELKRRLKEEYGGAVPWEDWLKQQGLTEESLRLVISKGAHTILMKRMIVNYFETSNESYDVAHILLSDKANAERVWTQLERGGNWKDLVNKESKDPGSLNFDGKLPRHYVGDGLFRKPTKDNPAQKDELTEDTLLGLKDGEYSRPAKSVHGWHIVKRLQTFPANQAKFFDRRGEFLAFADVDDKRFNRWVNVTMSRNEYTSEFRIPGMNCQPDVEGLQDSK
jgi:hypothetical protein